MNRLLLFSFILLSLICKAQMNVSGVKVPFVYKTEEGVLIVNGAGTRVKIMMDIYVAALYLKEKSKDEQKITDSDEAMVIQLTMVSSLITSEKMNQAIDEGFKKSTDGNTASLQDRINQFKSVFAEKINKTDVFDMVYQKSKGITLYKNNKPSVTIPGLDFKKALFGIWLSKKPVDEDLKLSLLGE